MLAPRALGPSTTTTTTNIFLPSSAANSTDQTTHENELAKTVLGWLFLLVAIILVVGVILRRLNHLRLTNQPFSNFFNFSRSWPSSRTRSNLGPHPYDVNALRRTGSPNPNSLLFPYYPDPNLVLPPEVHIYGQGLRRTRAADIDEGGRRIVDRGPSDHDGELDDKDVLPMYDTVGGPPKYVELEMQAMQRRLSEMTVHDVPMNEPRTSGTEEADTDRRSGGNSDGSNPRELDHEQEHQPSTGNSPSINQ